MRDATEYQNAHLLETRKAHTIWMLAQAIQDVSSISVTNDNSFRNAISRNAIRIIADAQNAITAIMNDEPASK